jgi:threonine dehydratase
MSTDLRAALEAARQRVSPYAHRTPVATCETLDRLAGRQLFFKCEQLQKVGAFKFRGAINAASQLPAEVAAKGLVTHSSGNHAQALALAAKLLGVPAHVVMPSNAKAVKRAAVEGYGARVIACQPTLEAREETAAEVLAETGGTLIPPYDHPWIIAGQASCALELCEQIGGLDAIVAPVGGGGLLSGTCLASAAQQVGARPRVYAAEPAGADDCARSLAAGELILQTAPNTIADGLLTSLGAHTWPIIRDHVAEVLVVDDDQIVEALRLLWERAKLLVEPSAAVGLAALLAARERFDELGHRRVGVILSGGNLDLGALPF